MIKNSKLKIKKIFPSLNPGDCLIHHSLAVHGSNKNYSNNSRKELLSNLLIFTQKLIKLEKVKYEKLLIKQIKKN